MSRQPNEEFQEWWNKQRANGTDDLFPSSSSSDNSSFLTVEIRSPIEKERTRSARQLSWIYLLKFQQIANSIAFLTNSFISIVRTANRRIVTSNSAPHRSSSRLYRVIKVFLTVSVILLVFELVAYFRGWHFSPPTVESSNLYANWLEIRANYLAPPLQSLTNMCIVLFLIQSVDRVVLVLGCFWIKFRRLKPLAEIDYVESVNVEDYPMVLLQIPMCNEREVYQQSIAAVCIQDWPKERMLVQILDDSDDLGVQGLIKAEVQKWQQRGVHIVYRHRLIRTGYKAGNLKSAMSCDYVKKYEFVAIFDADFQPTPDFLKNTIPYFKGHDDIALVQTRWAFVNKDENLLTRLQNINLAFHFEVEQQVNGWFINFFGFNGTAGVWRIKALEECGGWLERTTVEDMDIASLLPKKEGKPNSCAMARKTHRREAQLPAWVVCYVPGLMSVLNILPAPQSFPFIVPYLLFENTMSVTKFHAMISGLFQLGSSYEWIVTKKSGRSSEADLAAMVENESEPLLEKSTVSRSSSDSGLAELSKLEMANKKGKRKRNRLYRKELALAFILLTASVRSLLSAQGIHFYFLLFQGFTFLVVGLDLIGEQVS
ncbi:hypothetical protein RND71_014110 [Anisodus tanguticus]|uniref:glucomannan 4-beta-mannosyltransferase n=1 Tax=Anisodus tanguticus TaxID=243964 RepID=A0AAE1SAL6_9SOLA|nr:hypothetical protein RND71_014110 [Anisodus tanguticus]